MSRGDAFARIAAGQRRRTADQEAIRHAIQRITTSPDWQVVLDYLDHRERAETDAADRSGDTGALLRSAGRRSLLRELERLDERVTDDDRSDHRG